MRPYVRPFAWLAVLGLIVAWFALPSVEAAAVAVQRLPALLRAPLEGGTVSLAERLLDLGAGDTPGTRRLALGGVRFVAAEQASEDLTIHARARRALVATLRETAAARGEALELDGELIAAAHGVHLLFSLQDGRLGARAQLEGASFGASIPVPQSDRRALLPVLLASALVLLWRRPLVALAAGTVLGAGLALSVQTPAGDKTWDSVPGDFARVLLDELWRSGAWQPIATVLALLATWSITARNGGLGGFTAWLGARATNARRAQLATWACAGLACCAPPGKNVALGWALRTLSVRTRLSTEKLAWLLDSMGTAALGLCILSPFTGFAFQLAAAQDRTGRSAGELWLATLPWRSFCWLTLAFGLLVAASGRDFATMLAAERRARESGGATARTGRRVFAAPEPDPRTALQAWRMAAPLAVYALALLAQGLRDGGVFAGEFDPRRADAWLALAQVLDRPDTSLVAALAALLVALALSSVEGAERGVPAALARGLRAALRPCLLLFAAWAASFVSRQLGAGEVLAALLGDRVAPQVLPALVFLIGAATAFSFGDAFAALPLCLPVALGLAGSIGADFAGGAPALAVLSLAALLEGILAGSLLSPVSASSLSASIGAGADHTDHVRTQAPYALLSSAATLCFGFLAAGLYGIGAWSALSLCALAHAAPFLWWSRPSQRRSA